MFEPCLVEGPGGHVSRDVAHMIYAWSVWLESTLSFCHSVRII